MMKKAIGCFFAFCIVACSNTEFAKNYSKEKFDEINTGDEVELVLAKVGNPIEIYRYELKDGRAVSRPIRCSLDRMKNKEHDQMYVLYYSKQINTRKTYFHAHISVVEGLVTEKSQQKITE